MSDLDDYIADREKRVPGFRASVDAADARAQTRAALGLTLRRLRGKRSQTWLAAQMQTSESIVRRVEQGEDVRLSTLEKYAQALGKDLTISVS